MANASVKNSKINVNDILKRYDLNALITVVSDRLQDFNEHVIGMGYEDSYGLGFGENLEQALGLLYDLKLYRELGSTKKPKKIS